VRPPLDKHVQVVAVLSLIFAGLWAMVGLMVAVMLAIAGGVAGVAGVPVVGGVLGSLGAGVGLLVLAMVALYAATGALLLGRRPAGRTVAFVAAGVSLFSFPFGTAFGAYAIWALLRPEAVASLEAA
jgi:hypothetical protein